MALPTTLPTFRWSGAAAVTPIGNFSELTIVDKPLSGQDEIAFAIADAAIPAALPASVILGGFGEYYLTRRIRDAATPGVSVFAAKKRVNYGAEAVAAVLAFLQGNGIGDLVLTRTPAFRRWQVLATRTPIGNRLDRHGLQWLIAQQLKDKGSTPSLDTLRRELLKRGLMLVEGSITGYAIPNYPLSILPLEVSPRGNDADGKPITRALPAGTFIGQRNETLVDPLTRRLEFRALGESLSGGSAGFAEDLGNFARVNYGVIALEQRRYFELQTSETAEAAFDYDATWRVGDIAVDGDMQSWRVTGARHSLNMTSQTVRTTLQLAKRYTPSEADIRKGSPDPFNTESPRLEARPDPPIVGTIAAVDNELGRRVITTTAVGGAAWLLIRPGSNKGKPIRFIKVVVLEGAISGDSIAGQLIVHHDQFVFNGFKPFVEVRYLGLDSIKYTFQVTAINEFGESAPANVEYTPGSRAPALYPPVALTGGDAYALHAPDGMVGAAATRALEQRIGAIGATQAATTDAITDTFVNYPQSSDTQLFIVGESGRTGVVDTAIARPLTSNQRVFGVPVPLRVNRDNYLIAFASFNARGSRAIMQAQYRVGDASDPKSVSDVNWSAWKDLSSMASPPPRGTHEDPNPVIFVPRGIPGLEGSYQFVLRIDYQGVTREGSPIPTEKPYLQLQFRLQPVGRTTPFRPEGSPTEWVTLKAIDTRQWTGAITHVRHYDNDGYLKSYYATGDNALTFL